jgi:hypothetical protein
MSAASTSAAPVPCLAHAFLALGDDGLTPSAPSPVAVLAALAAALVIALSAPLAWAAAPAPKPADQPAATAASKASVPAPDDVGPDGGM